MRWPPPRFTPERGPCGVVKNCGIHDVLSENRGAEEYREGKGDSETRKAHGRGQPLGMDFPHLSARNTMTTSDPAAWVRWP